MGAPRTRHASAWAGQWIFIPGLDRHRVGQNRRGPGGRPFLCTKAILNGQPIQIFSHGGCGGTVSLPQAGVSRGPKAIIPPIPLFPFQWNISPLFLIGWILLLSILYFLIIKNIPAVEIGLFIELPRWFANFNILWKCRKVPPPVKHMRRG